MVSGQCGGRAYFAAMADRVVSWLIAAGVPPCAGGFMATTWRYPLADWSRCFKGWLSEPAPRALIAAMNLFDFRGVHGTLALQPLQDEVLALCREPLFVAHLARASLGMEPPLGFFRQIRQAEQGVDLKKGAIVPIVNLARLYALDARSAARATVARLDAATAGGTLSREAAATLGEAFGFVLDLRLREPARGLAPSGLPATNHVRLEQLSSLDARHLKDVFHAIREVQAATVVRYATDRLA